MTTAPTPALLPCPFCGSAKVETKNEHTDLSGGYYIECSACLACTGLRYACGEDPRPPLAEQWNRRAEPKARKPQRLTTRREVTADGKVRVTRVRTDLELRKSLPPDALADKCEAWLQAGGAANIVDAFEAGYRAAENVNEGKKQ
ncbi:Lar family restriction alleviation protein [Polaromonas sp.]|uniref:Lar family restriction alleviation protein n=1 Tax=Polaromonas sp. TaxID=1869339 RepID=UPI00352B3D88